METMRIAICEDEPVEARMLEFHINKWRMPVEIEKFSNADDFLASYWPYKYSLVFMDICMTGTDGVQAVETIRSKDMITPIAFTTGSSEYTRDGYRLGVMRYIEKPVDAASVHSILEIANVLKDNPTGASVSLAKGTINLLIDAIIYMEQNGNEINFHMADGRNVLAKGKLDDYADELNIEGFYRFHRNYMVNVKFAVAMDRELLVYNMVDGTMASIRRESLKEAREAIEAYGYNN